ncbi:Protein kinase-like domain [Pseudocohnilembus persalinus]|uniref:Protein kinase-like domain n=1 Tax=Pseudocohnilembus persalinus TaxID=266149 RepID=A0A0V0QEV2_PSEPJ|nr:Protein kinase-like domain [Pseudocohnilembus persalinus]|eukprot:KRX00703.1 Protein kinase-like domain [Pseudocohnilembus persalinus]
MENKINYDVFTQPDEKNNLDEEYEQNLTEQEKNKIYNDYLDRKQNQTIQEIDNCIQERSPGGDLGTLLTRKRKFTEEIARIYIAEIISALEYLHRNEIIYRDLKPENIILDKNGHIKITDFGLAKKLLNDSQTRTYLGTPAYFAPEIIMKSGHNRMVDWWTVGILLYECLVGMPPFYSRQREELFENIKTAPIKIPKSMSQEAKDLIKQLLNRNPKKRLGAQNDAIDIKNHIFFKDFNWDDLLDKKFQMPEVQIDKIPESELIIQFKEKQDPLKDIKDWTIISD